MTKPAHHHQSLIDMPAMIGPYRPVSPIGQGGMAKVYRAVHPLRQNVPVAIKQILPDHAVHAQFRSAFARELETTASFRHSNIVRMHEHGIAADGTPYMVMELVEGLDLRSFQRTHAGHRLPPAWTVLIALDLAHALASVHDTNRAGAAVLHRDISPQNVLLTPQGDAKLTDFGIAKALDAQGEATATVAVSGKLMYMSPEQAMGEDLDARADLYSLGLVLYELVAGEPAFPGSGQTKLFARVRAAERSPLVDVAPPETPQLLIEIIEDLLRPDREDRTRDAATLVRQLSPLEPAFLERLDLARAVAEYRHRDTGLPSATAPVARSLPSRPPNATMEIQPGDIVTAAPGRLRPLPEPPAEVATDAPTTPKPIATGAATSILPKPSRGGAKKRVLQAAAFVAMVAAGIGIGTLLSTAQTVSSALPGHLEGPAASTTPEPTLPPATPAPAAVVVAAAPASPAPVEPTASPSPPAAVTPTAPSELVEPAVDEPAVPQPTPVVAVPAATPTSSSSSSSSSPSERPRGSAPAAPGTVRVVVLPWGNVWVDGVAQGQAPQALTLRPGRHTIAVGPGAQTQRRTVTVRSGDSSTVRFDLRE